MYINKSTTFSMLCNPMLHYKLQSKTLTLTGTTAANPYSTSTHHSNLAPWMGQQSRSGNILPKTEIKKALTKKTDHSTHPTKNINEDIILEIIESKKVLYMLICIVCDVNTHQTSYMHLAILHKMNVINW